ncbi:MAG: DASS family sodium-coupled anion symporter [Roseibium sp.]|uniref:SLC13 family permease n=1 Tax=Roseibium sp. TaxID=1936156 RepID=UPI002631DF7B|nr:DASS family sodium-coupled anion symporter [Roseibium sp.]MCV0424737.1 DASS family sodium-coupled anion symporter [Roseibium sp.]
MQEVRFRPLGSRIRITLALVCGSVLYLLMRLLDPPAGMSENAWALMALLLWMVAWWLSEALPLAVTALLPVIVMPLSGIAEIGTVTGAYGHPLIFLFLGGFMLAMAIESVGLHRRIALAIVSRVGTRPRDLTLGFMIATAFLSMWITNTAATIMMYAVALSVIDFIKAKSGASHTFRRFSIGLMLAVAYSASIGGMATLIGSPVNALLATILAGEYGITVEFVDWLLIGLPVTLIMLAVAWFLLTFILYPSSNVQSGDLAEAVQNEQDRLPPVSRAEKTVAVVFTLAALGWIFGDQISYLTGLPISDTAVALTAAIFLFAIPVNKDMTEFALDWRTAARLPWNVLLLIGGGLAVALAFQLTGLADWIGERVSGLDIAVFAMVLLVTTMMVFLTEIMSNPASAATILPVVSAVAVGLDLTPLILAVPAALAANMSFMMPVATAPNAIVFSNSDLKILDMAKAGLWLNLCGIAVCTLSVYFIFRPLSGW